MVDFFVIGAQKAGTTALARVLRQHPDIQMSAKKEIHFFDKERITDWAAPDWHRLHKHFDWSTRNVLRGEATPIYLYWPPALHRLRAYNSAARLIVGLRHPAHRAYSHWRMVASQGMEHLSFETAISDAARGRVRNAPMGAHRLFSYVERGLYAEQIERAQALFPRQQMFFFGTDMLWLHPARVLADMERFLEATPALRPAAGWSYISPVAPADVDEVMPADVRVALTRYFSDDVRRTSALTGLDLADWLDESYSEPMSRSARSCG